VKKVRHKVTKKLMALKIIQLDVNTEVRKRILLELKTLYHAQSPHIVNFYGAFFTEGHIYICLVKFFSFFILFLFCLLISFSFFFFFFFCNRNSWMQDPFIVCCNSQGPFQSQLLPTCPHRLLFLFPLRFQSRQSSLISPAHVTGTARTTVPPQGKALGPPRH